MNDNKYEMLMLENQSCFPLYAASRLMTRIYKDSLDKLGITYPQYIALMVLWSEDGVPISKIGEKLLLNTNTLTPLLSRLESMGFISKVRDSKDERIVKIYLTKEGQLLKERALEIPIATLKKIDYPQEKLVSLKKDLDLLVDKMKKIEM